MASMLVSEYPHTETYEPSHQPHLLLVDDEIDQMQVLEFYLHRQGYQVTLVQNAQQAIQCIFDHPPDLLIVDLNLPDMSGLELTMQVRQDPDINYLPVIIITAQDEERKRLQSMISGADDYLPKPINERDLLVRVQALLRTKAHIDRLMYEKRRLLDDLAAHNAALEQAHLFKKNVLTTVSHEMGTPLLQVKSALYLLVEDVRKTEPENQPAKLATLAVSRLEGIIQNITDLVRVENMKLDSFLARDAIDLAIRAMERSWVAKEAAGRIMTELDADLPPAYGDRRAVARVLHILLDNAIKFDPDGHPVTVQVTRDGDHHLTYVVTDQGIGIAADQLDLIFQEFYQVDSSTTRPFGGSGIGLSLAKMLCGRMNVEIKVKSRLGKGSTFYFSLPCGKFD